MSVYVIAEAGASHGGRLDTALDLIYAAKETGADCIKFQVWKAEKFAKRSSPLYKHFWRTEFTERQWEYLKAHAESAKIDFLASAWDLDSVDFLDRIGMKAFKVGSGDLTHEPIIRHIGSKGKPVIMSTGMATREEISRAVNWLGMVPLTLLKCTVDYPCAENDVNLAGMADLKYFTPHYGFSDHTKGHLAACMAVALGVSVIEKHFALKETEEAIGAEQFREWVKQVRQAERIMGSSDLGTFECEQKWKTIARRGESGLRE